MNMQESMEHCATLSLRETDAAFMPETMFTKASEIRYIKTLCALAYTQGYKDAINQTYTRAQVLGLEF
jgi:hypothetical protein